MKKSKTQSGQTMAGRARLTTVENLVADEFKFTPSPDEVARRAYFSYENQGSLPGREVQHWLTAEADLIAERELTRIHAFHHDQQTQRHPPTTNGAKINL
jgi:hypothetical protein